MKVLIVDDEPFNLISAQMIIESNFENLKTKTELSGYDCLKTFEQSLMQ